MNFSASELFILFSPPSVDFSYALDKRYFFSFLIKRNKDETICKTHWKIRFRGGKRSVFWEGGVFSGSERWWEFAEVLFHFLVLMSGRENFIYYFFFFPLVSDVTNKKKTYKMEGEENFCSLSNWPDFVVCVWQTFFRISPLHKIPQTGEKSET